MKRADPKKVRKAKSNSTTSRSKDRYPAKVDTKPRKEARTKVRSIDDVEVSQTETPPLEVVLPRKIKGRTLITPLTDSIPPIQPSLPETEVAGAVKPEVSLTETEAAPPQPADMDSEKVKPTVTFERGRQLLAIFRQPFILGVLVFILTLAFISGIFYLLQKFAPVDVPIASPSPELPSPKPILDRSEWIFEVLNGSGIAGEAAKSAQLLRERGFLVIKVSNVASPSAETQLYVSEASLAEADLLLEDLEEKFAIASLSGLLQAVGDSTATARLVIGKK